MKAWMITGAYALTLGLAAPALATPPAPDCNSLYAARVKDLAGLADCHTATLAVDSGQVCLAGETANACADRAYFDAELVSLPAGSGKFTSKWLGQCRDGTNSCATPELRCYDGTRPMVRVDKAVDSAGDDMYSNGWVIHMGGEGGPCTGAACWDMYTDLTDGPFMRAMSTLHPDFITERRFIGKGIMSHKTLHGGDYNNFAHFNRVKFNRCSDGASATTQIIPTPMGVVPVFHQGEAIYEGLMHYLASVDGRDLGGGGNQYADGLPDLPPFANATHVLLTGSSDATIWLVQNADRIRAHIEAIAPNAKVALAIDGYFAPMLSNEARYNSNVGTNVFDGVFENATGDLLPAPRGGSGAAQTYSDGKYLVGSPHRDSWDARGVLVDDSCLAANPDPKVCYDHQYVLLNHVDTPFFIIADQRDNTIGDLPAYADDDTYQFNWTRYRTRVLDQGRDIVDRYATESEMAPGGLDPDAGPVGWSQGVFLHRPDANKHVHFGNNDRFFNTRMNLCDGPTLIDSYTMTQALHRWLIYDTAFDAMEDPRRSTGLHWVTDPQPCGAPR